MYLLQSAMASAPAVPSSRSEAFDTGRAIRSDIMVWKLRRLSSRPWASSAWYGVYWVVLGEMGGEKMKRLFKKTYDCLVLKNEEFHISCLIRYRGLQINR